MNVPPFLNLPLRVKDNEVTGEEAPSNLSAGGQKRPADEIDMQKRPAKKHLGSKPETSTLPGPADKLRNSHNGNLFNKETLRDIDALMAHNKGFYFAHEKPLLFLTNANQTQYTTSYSYLTGWRQEYNRQAIHGTGKVRDLNLTAGYILPGTKEPIIIGPIDGLLEDNKLSTLHTLLLMPHGSNKDINSEGNLIALVTASYCFASGTFVKQNDAMAEAILKDLAAEKTEIGFNLAMHHAASTENFDMARYFYEKGANIHEVWDGNHTSTLDVAARSPDNSFLRLIISNFSNKHDLEDLKYIIDVDRSLISNETYSLITQKIKDIEKSMRQ